VNLKRFPLLSVLVCLLHASFAGGVSAQGSDPKAKKVVDNAVAGLGGDKFLSMRTRVTTGRAYRFYNEQLSGLDIATIYSEELDHPAANGVAIRERQVFGKKQDYSVLFLGDQGWDITFRGARPLPDETWERYQRTTENNILYILRHRLNEPGLTFDYIGTDVQLNAEVVTIEIADMKGRVVRVVFDKITGLPVRQSFTYLDPTRVRIEESMDFSKYRESNGAKWPLTVVRSRNGEKVYELFAEKLQVNEGVPEDKFSLPPGVTVLKKSN
jgi:hypothetical protein